MHAKKMPATGVMTVHAIGAGAALLLARSIVGTRRVVKSTFVMWKSIQRDFSRRSVGRARQRCFGAGLTDACTGRLGHAFGGAQAGGRSNRQFSQVQLAYQLRAACRGRAFVPIWSRFRDPVHWKRGIAALAAVPTDAGRALDAGR